MKVQPAWSQRLLRKGALVEETYRLFANWDFGLSPSANLARGLGGRQATQGWEEEVVATVRRRIRDFGAVKSLILLTQRQMPIGDWRHCLRLWVGATEEPFHSFATGWLFEEHVRGLSAIRSEDLLPVVDAAAKQRREGAPPLSEYGRIRTARDLLRAATELGMVKGSGPVRSFASITMSDDVLLYHVQLISELEGETSRVPASRLWRLAYMTPQDVHLALLHLHQFRRLDYQVAGSLTQLALPAVSTIAFAAQVSP